MKKKEIKGMGDVVEIVTQKTGVKKIMPKDCGCDKRKKWLNEKIPIQKRN